MILISIPLIIVIVLGILAIANWISPSDGFKLAMAKEKARIEKNRKAVIEMEAVKPPPVPVLPPSLPIVLSMENEKLN